MTASSSATSTAMAGSTISRKCSAASASRGSLELAQLDSNGDGKITTADILWSELKVWQDYDRDGVTDVGELKTLDQLGIVTLDLGTTALDIRTPQGARLTAVGDVTFERRRRAAHVRRRPSLERYRYEIRRRSSAGPTGSPARRWTSRASGG